MFYNKNAGYGLLQSILAQNGILTFGKILVVFNSSNTANFSKMAELFNVDPDGKVRFYQTLAAAVDAATTNANDVILLEAGGTSNKVASILTIDKNRVHVIGVDPTAFSGRLTNQRCLVSNTGAGAATDTAMIAVTGTGCSFRNIAFKNNWTVAQNLYAVNLSGANNTLFVNCSFQNLGSAHLTNANAAPLCLTGAEDSEFVNCTIGEDTLKSTVASSQVCLITGAVTRTTFIGCLFRQYTSQSTAVMVNIVGNGSNNLQLFRNCAFVNRVNGGTTTAVAVKSDATTAGDVVFDVTTFASGVTDFATAAVGNTGMFIASPVPTAGTSGIAVQPTA